ncbi:MAG: S8 family serine peptidase, partial [Candidatus Cloacimonas sp.]|nr:S8 family serine peptidase [Candidatus Cloacimonadota bacterium]
MDYKKGFIVSLMMMLFLTTLVAVQLEKGSEGLNEVLELMQESGDKLPVIIVLKDQVDVDEHYQSIKDLPKSERRQLTIDTLKQHSNRTQVELKKLLDKLQSDKKVTKVNYFWISNVISLEATKGALVVLDKRNEIERIEYDPVVKVIDDLEENSEYIPSEFEGGERSYIWNLEQMDVPEVWEAGVYGGGVLVGVFDTGVNYNHYDIRDRMWYHPDYPNNGWDFFHDDDDPMDIYDHGTHCAGSVAGDGTSGTQTGIAPKSRIMALKTTSDQGGSQQHVVWNAIQFALDHGVDVFSMSLGWYQTMNVDFKTWRDVMVNVLSAGVPASLSAGNEAGDSDKAAPLNIRVPGNCPAPWLHPDQEERGGVTSVLCIGASNSRDQIAFFSSYGPATWQDVESYNDYPYRPSEGKMGLIKP